MKYKFFISLLLTVPFFNCSDYSETPAVQSRSLNKSLPAAFLEPDSLNPEKGPFKIEKMLVSIGLNVVAKNTENLLFKAGNLKNELSLYCSDLQQAQDSDDAKIKDLWKQTMLAYHKLSMIPLGPIAKDDSFFEREIYSWPVVSECGIDQEVIKKTSGDLTPVLINRKSLSALEYLLFEDTLVSKCTAFVEPKAKDWSAQTAAIKKQDRCDYAVHVANSVYRAVYKVHREWAQDSGNYTVSLIDGSQFSKLDQAVNSYTDALFAFETFRDEDLGVPLGLVDDCTSSTGLCLELVEHPWSNIGIDAVLAKIDGFHEAFFGSAALAPKAYGLDDYLENKNFSEIAVSLEKALTSAKTQADLLKKQNSSLKEMIANVDKEKCKTTTTENRLDPVCALYQDIREVTNLLKIEIISALALNAPAAHAGDAD